MGLSPFFGIPHVVLDPAIPVAEAIADAQFVERIRAYEDHYGVGRLPYWLRYYDPILDAEYRCRMAELAATVAEIDDRDRTLKDGKAWDPLAMSKRERLAAERAASKRVAG